MVDPENCTACGICELICSFEHHGQYNPKKSYI
ncbi:MAG: 4Fe-4S binding protein, partial [Nitrospinota bacterium]